MTTKEKLLKALDIEKKGEWNKAHEIVQVIEHELAYWIHAYLHRKEKDEWNAGYWYRQANRPFSKLTFDEELKEIVEFVLI